MGASLAHLVIRDLNLTRMESVGWSTSIDLAVTDPLTKAETCFPFATQCLRAHWASSDHVLRTIYIPLVSSEIHVQGREGDKIDVTHVNILPRHVLYGGTSAGFGTDPELEEKVDNEPGFLMVNDARYNLIDFKAPMTHVIIRYFNLDTMQTIGIDVEKKEEDLWPLTTACQDAHWEESDSIVRIEYELLSNEPFKVCYHPDGQRLETTIIPSVSCDKMEREVLSETSQDCTFQVGEKAYFVKDFAVVKMHAS